MFQRTVLINLKSRPDRIEKFRMNQRTCGWRLEEPEIIAALRGDTIGVPSWWRHGGGAWGLNRVCARLLEDSLMNETASLMVFEDDVCWTESAWDDLDIFLKEVPTDWNALLLGGQHVSPPKIITRNVARCTNTHRTHSWVIRGKTPMQALLKMWYEKNAHIDHSFAEYQKTWKCYAPQPFIFGQREGKSDISGRNDVVRYWSSISKPSDYVLILRSNRQIKEALSGFHGGYWVHRQSGLDNGLIEISTLSGDVRKKKLEDWFRIIISEAEQNRCIPLVWHDSITAEEVKEIVHKTVIEIKADSVEEVMKRWGERV